MLVGDFARKIKQLNRDLKIACGNDDSRPASLFYVDRYGEEVSICGIDKNYVPEWPEYNPNGSFKKSGWRRTLKILIGKGLIDKYKAQRLFRVDLNYKQPKYSVKCPDVSNRGNTLGLDVLKQGGL